MSDAYERDYLGGDEAVYREKRVSRRSAGVLGAVAAGPAVLSVLSALAAFGGDPQGIGGALLMGGLAAFLGLLAITTTVGRVVVTRTELRFMIGLKDMRVPLSAIEGLSLGKLDPLTVRFRAAQDRAELANVYEANERFVRIAWRDAKGKARVLWIASDTPEALMEAIDRTRRSGAPRVRVAEESGSQLDAEEIGDEVEAPEARSRRARDAT